MCFRKVKIIYYFIPLDASASTHRDNGRHLKVLDLCEEPLCKLLYVTTGNRLDLGHAKARALKVKNENQIVQS